MSDQYAQAKGMYFDYDGSTYYMVREGVWQEFRSYDVPRRAIEAWRQELTALRVESLHSSDGRSVVRYLEDCRDGRFLSQVVSALPSGEPWQVTAYLESALSYWQSCAGLRWYWRPTKSTKTAYGRTELLAAVDWIIGQASVLIEETRMYAQADRLRTVIEEGSKGRRRLLSRRFGVWRWLRR